MVAPLPIVAVTPNLALDRTLTLPGPLQRGRLQRVESLRERAGGKGVNLARAVRCFGGTTLVVGFVAGFNGRKLLTLLEREGFDAVLEEVPGETRQCTILLDGGDHPTEINEAGPTVDEAAWEGLWQRVRARQPLAAVVVSGSLPPGLEPKSYARALRSLPGPVVVDASGAALIHALEAGVALVKPNEREALEVAELLGIPTAGGGSVAVARELHRRYGARVLLTRGAAGATLVGEEVWTAAAPRVEAINPVASGDSLLGAFLWAESVGRSTVDALRLGIAAGADNARRGGGATLDANAVEAMARAIVPTQVA